MKQRFDDLNNCLGLFEQSQHAVMDSHRRVRECFHNNHTTLMNRLREIIDNTIARQSQFTADTVRHLRDRADRNTEVHKEIAEVSLSLCLSGYLWFWLLAIFLLPTCCSILVACKPIFSLLSVKSTWPCKLTSILSIALLRSRALFWTNSTMSLTHLPPRCALRYSSNKLLLPQASTTGRLSMSALLTTWFAFLHSIFVFAVAALTLSVVAQVASVDRTTDVIKTYERDTLASDQKSKEEFLATLKAFADDFFAERAKNVSSSVSKVLDDTKTTRDVLDAGRNLAIAARDTCKKSNEQAAAAANLKIVEAQGVIMCVSTQLFRLACFLCLTSACFFSFLFLIFFHQRRDL